ncbi:MAG: Holliday junction resolvase RuvX [Saccharofermentans sp.]|nr:Holliday junction resolvase RuvX [Saccharofermentans sp.]
MGRIMGIDYGMRRIGIALSDVTHLIAKGSETINWNGRDIDWALNRIGEIIKEQDVTDIVLGRPLRTDGTGSETQEKVEGFAKLLEDTYGLPIHYIDERFTTVIAAQYLHAAGKKADKHKKVIDQVAAEVFLQDYLDSHRS